MTRNVWNHDSGNDLVPCPECHAYMLSLKEYDMNSPGDSPTASLELWEILLWGWTVIFWNYIYDLMTHQSRLRRLQEKKRQILPQFPNSLICPECLFVKKRP